MKTAKVISVTLFIVLFGIAIYFISAHFGRTVIEEILGYFSPCAYPITYRIGSVDSRFGISEKEFENTIEKAVLIWEEAAHKNLFELQNNGALAINLVYDYRQEATERLENIGVIINNSQEGYADLEKKYESVITEYGWRKTELDQLVSNYNERKKSYELDVTRWNSRDTRLTNKNEQGTLRQEFERLNNEKSRLLADADIIEKKQKELNELVNNINALVDAMNNLARELNLSVSTYNKIGETRGQEFQEGVYKSNVTGKEIDIYEFDSPTRLLRVLTHEFGHALGLPHVDNPKAIMYELNQAMNEKLAPEDLIALKNRCGIHE
ncbi:MAG: hypothetical protein A3B25_00615 [Candidatus Ryanbacteria bacterium RIFCSPLOWO2_01_FULL_48_26]|uniref:Peptidase M10 metallopeptidase domain-containing protein n=1 Tax=Candidatus Ryanbacteria bacterium RIFCSPLOWO2_01_FULL_48_26 TaxID=1802126 RepID=A0A1G2GUG2_9BACT|nr:MAG: hypothetical protein A3B25_00615 [Candidatus Ryanbacteria bacterium RIFCSPLOWO2_01_FULL_48_26]